MQLGSLFSNRSLARQALQVKKVAKKGIFDINWPEKPKQQVKDYKVITTAAELIAYLKRCEETGICGFDYETTVSDEYREIYNKKRNLAMENVLWAKENNDKSLLKTSEKELDTLEEAFLKAPLDPWKSEICTVSLSAAPHEARVVFINNWGRNHFKTDWTVPGGGIKGLIKATRERVFNILNEYLFKNKNIMKIAVNLSFETKQTAKLGMYIMEPVADPFIMWVRCMQVVAPDKIKDPKQPASGKGLKPMTKEVFGVEMTPFEEVLKSHGVQFFSEISADDPQAVEYSAEDSDYAVQHYLYWREIAKQIPQYDEWLHTVEMPFTRVIGLMEYNGLLWNDDIADVKAQEAVLLQEQAITELKQLAKTQGVDLHTGKTGKTNDVKKFLFETLACPKASISEKTGDPSLDKEALLDLRFMLENKMNNLDEEEWLREDHPKHAELLQRQEHPHKAVLLKTLELISKIQKYTTLLSSHIEGRRKFVNEVSKRIHAQYSQWTETGRLNSFHPNGQNVPRPDNDVFGIRNFFKAPEGKVLFLIDFSGFELRLVAWRSGDEVMTETFAHGDGDLHRKTAATITGKKPEDVTKAERYRAKAPNFLINYGGSEYALQKNLKTQYDLRESLPECAKLIQAVKDTYPKIPVFQENIALKAREDGYVQTIYGYMRLLPNINSTDRRLKGNDERRASNTPIQGSAADIMKLRQNECYELLASNAEYAARATLCAQIHDEQIFELDDDPDFVERFATEVKSIMEKPPLPDFPIPIEAEPSIGYQWGEKKDLDKWLEARRNG